MPDTLPTISAVTLNKTAYAKGEQMLLSVTGTDPDEEIVEVTVSLRNKASGATSAPQTTTAVVDELESVVADSGVRTWTFVGRTGDTFTVKATA